MKFWEWFFFLLLLSSKKKNVWTGVVMSFINRYCHLEVCKYWEKLQLKVLSDINTQK